MLSALFLCRSLMIDYYAEIITTSEQDHVVECWSSSRFALWSCPAKRAKLSFQFADVRMYANNISNCCSWRVTSRLWAPKLSESDDCSELLRRRKTLRRKILVENIVDSLVLLPFHQFFVGATISSEMSQVDRVFRCSIDEMSSFARKFWERRRERKAGYEWNGSKSE